jgi:septum site-determining protein MinD
MCKVILIASGKGGVGKTTLTAGLSTSLAAIGFKVLCVDGDMGLGNLDIALGLSDRSALDFLDVIRGDNSLASALIRHSKFNELCLLNAPLTYSEDITEGSFSSFISEAAAGFDYCFIDCAAGLGTSFTIACRAAMRGIIVCTPDAASLRDAAKTARFAEEMGVADIKLVVNRVRPWLIKSKDAPNIDDSMDETGLMLLGVVPEDERVITSQNHSETLIMNSSDGAARAYLNIARRLAGDNVPIMKKL